MAELEAQPAETDVVFVMSETVLLTLTESAEARPAAVVRVNILECGSRD